MVYDVEYGGNGHERVIERACPTLWRRGGIGGIGGKRARELKNVYAAKCVGSLVQSGCLDVCCPYIRTYTMGGAFNHFR